MASTAERGEDRPSHLVEIGTAHRAENGVLAISELGHLPPQFRNRRRAMPRCPIAPGDQIERHPKLDLNWSRMARLRSASQSCSRGRPGLPFTGKSPRSPSGATVHPGNMPASHSAVAQSITITVLGFRVVGIAWRNTHHSLIEPLANILLS